MDFFGVFYLFFLSGSALMECNLTDNRSNAVK
jgi:hypothetical protein